MRVISRFKFMLVAVMAMTLSYQLQANGSILNGENEWTLITQEKGVKAYAMIQNCEDGEIFIFKFDNTSSQDVSFEYTIEALKDPSFPPISKLIELAQGSSVVGNCQTLWEYSLPKLMGEGSRLKELVDVKLNFNPKTK